MARVKNAVSFLVFILNLCFLATAACQPAAAPTAGNLNPSLPLGQVSSGVNTQTPQNPSLIAKITSLNGDVRIKETGNSTWQKANPGRIIMTGSQIKTGQNGKVKIEIENGNLLFIKPNTTLVFSELFKDQLTQKYNNIFTVNKGNIKAQVKDTANLYKFEINTPTSIAGVRGTVLYLRVRPAFTQLFVKDGIALLENKISGKIEQVNDGYVSSSDAGGNVSAPEVATAEQQEEFQAAWEPEAQAQPTAQEDADGEIQGTQETLDESQTDAETDRLESQNVELIDYIDNPGAILEADTDSDGTYDSEDIDDDNDGLSDTFETDHGLNAKNSDSDGDGLNDFIELMVVASFSESDIAYNAIYSDSDADGTNDYDEFIARRNPSAEDTDNDGYSDAEEVAAGTSPTVAFSFPGGITHNLDLDDEPDNYDFDKDGDEIDFYSDGGVDRGESAYNLDGSASRMDSNLIDTDGDGLSDWAEARIGCNPVTADTDGDGWDDKEEYDLARDPDNPLDSPPGPGAFVVSDSDSDLLGDKFESSANGWGFGTLPLDNDTDNDGLTDGNELRWGTNPNDTDTDDDGRSDYDEVYAANLTEDCDPLKADTDDDGANDGTEITAGTDPENPALFPGNILYDFDLDGVPDNFDWDDDNDGLSDEAEAFLGTNDRCSDSDGDAILDAKEINYGFDPANSDSDSDGILDGSETLPEGYFDITLDTDNDKLPDYYETILGTSPTDSDSDDDGFSDGFEVSFFSRSSGDWDYGRLNPLDDDTDGDGLTDEEEILTYSTSPFISDTDSDGISDYDEITYTSTDPNLRDTDSDGLLDGAERQQGSNPSSANSDGDGVGDALDSFPMSIGGPSRTDMRTKRYYQLEETIADLRSEISDMFTDIYQRQSDFVMDKISDAKMHKVITDSQGNTVRVEEYVFRPSPTKVVVLSLSQRVAGAAGINMLEWTVEFSSSLNSLSSSQLRALPWDKYLSAAPNYGATQPSHYPDTMSLKLEEPAGDSMTERRTYGSLWESAGNWYQSISQNELSINTVDGGVFKDLTVSNIVSGNPATFKYSTSSSEINFTIDVIPGDGSPLSGSYTFNNLWEALSANLNGAGATNYVGAKYVEIRGDDAPDSLSIDSIFIPFSNLDWKTTFSWEGADE